MLLSMAESQQIVRKALLTAVLDGHPAVDRVRVPHLDNASTRQPATFVAAFLLSEGEDRLIVMLQ